MYRPWKDSLKKNIALNINCEWYFSSLFSNSVSKKYRLFALKFYMIFMADDVIEVDPKTETICCDGGEDGLGHPAVYYTFNNQNKIVCGYCGKVFIRKEE